MGKDSGSSIPDWLRIWEITPMSIGSWIVAGSLGYVLCALPPPGSRSMSHRLRHVPNTAASVSQGSGPSGTQRLSALRRRCSRLKSSKSGIRASRDLMPRVRGKIHFNDKVPRIFVSCVV